MKVIDASKRVLKPEEIAELVYSEFTPFSEMSLEQTKTRIAELIQEYAEDYHSKKSLRPIPQFK